MNTHCFAPQIVNTHSLAPQVIKQKDLCPCDIKPRKIGRYWVIISKWYSTLPDDHMI